MFDRYRRVGERGEVILIPVKEAVREPVDRCSQPGHILEVFNEISINDIHMFSERKGRSAKFESSQAHSKALSALYTLTVPERAVWIHLYPSNRPIRVGW